MIIWQSKCFDLLLYTDIATLFIGKVNCCYILMTVKPTNLENSIGSHSVSISQKKSCLSCFSSVWHKNKMRKFYECFTRCYVSWYFTTISYISVIADLIQTLYVVPQHINANIEFKQYWIVLTLSRPNVAKYICDIQDLLLKYYIRYKLSHWVILSALNLKKILICFTYIRISIYRYRKFRWKYFKHYYEDLFCLMEHINNQNICTVPYLKNESLLQCGSRSLCKDLHSEVNHFYDNKPSRCFDQSSVPLGESHSHTNIENVLFISKFSWLVYYELVISTSDSIND